MKSTDDRWTRREFIAKSSAAGLGLAMGGSMAQAGETAESLLVGADGMPLVKLGKTEKTVSILGFGGSLTITPPLLNVAIQRGVNYIDTSENYGRGNSERAIGEILETSGKRKEIFITTKTGNHDPTRMEERLDGSLERLRTDYVDAFFLHNLGDPNRLNDEMKAAVEKLKRSRKIRFFGFSSHHGNLIPTLERAAACGFVDVIMLKYNFRDYGDEALDAALDKCSKAGIGLAAMKTGAGAVPRFEEFEQEGLKRQVVAVKAVWADERIHVVVSEMTNIKQVEENTAAAKDRRMGHREWELLERYARATDYLYCRGCGHRCEPACGNAVAIADILRYKMYYEGYGDQRRARELFAVLPAEAREIAGRDFRASEAACPFQVPIGRLMAEAARELA